MTDTPFALGRVVNHDPKSKEYPARAATITHSVTWRRYGTLLDQGAVGACTGFAAAYALNSKPAHRLFSRTNRNRDALDFYSWATQADDFPGTWPGEDTGSSGLGVAKGLQQHGKISGYTHAFGLDHLIAALQYSPGLVGTDWFEGMFQPDSNGFVNPTGAVAGGHEWFVRGVDLVGKFFIAQQSWGPWGKWNNGRFLVSFSTMTFLLDRQGDVTVLNS